MRTLQQQNKAEKNEYKKKTLERKKYIKSNIFINVNNLIFTFLEKEREREKEEYNIICI